MLIIRLQRVGKKNAASFRVILTEKSSPVKGKFKEILGFYNPRTKERKLEAERIQYWLSHGAAVSPTVHNMLVSEKVIEGEKVKAWRPKKKQIKEGEEEKTEENKAEAGAETDKPAGDKESKTEDKPDSLADKPAEDAKKEIKDDKKGETSGEDKKNEEKEPEDKSAESKKEEKAEQLAEKEK